ncbi:MAG: hypothetical protein KJS74_10480, partial [Rhodospirillales bacterium]|nr:hypothetical protein [Rhodospirillales bacterium]
AVLNSSGSLSQSGGKLTAVTLAGSIANNASLNGTQNSIGTLAGFTAGGTLSLTDQTALTQTGSLAAASITLTGTSLALEGTESATTMALDATSGISQAGTGVLSVATLSSNTTPSGAILLGGTANAIGTLGALAGGQNIFIADSQTAAITGLVSAGTALTLQGVGFTESGAGAIAAQTLTAGAGSLSGGLALGGNNAIGTLGALSAGGNVTLNDAQALTIAGLVSTPGTLNLSASGAVNEAAGGALDVTQLSGTAGGNVALAGANSIGTLGALGAAGNIVLDDTGTMTLGGAVSAGTSLALAANGLLAGGGSLSAGTIALAPYNNGAIDLGGSAVSGLQLSQSLVSELDPAAVVILGSAAGHTANSIFSEGTVSFANALATLEGTGGISQTGTLSGHAITLTGTSLALDGVVNATSLALAASGAISQASTGALDVTQLGGTAGGNVALAGANSIGTLGALSATGTINLQDSTALDVAGAVSAGSSLALSAPTLTLANTLRGGGISLVADNITDMGGALAAPGGTVSIAPRTPNLTVDLGGSTAGLDLSGTLLGAITAAALDISTQGGIIADGVASVSTSLLSLSGDGITFAGTLSAPGTLALSSGAGVTSSAAGHLTAGTLLAGGTIAGNIDLLQGSDSIGALGSIALNGGSLSLTDA